MPMTASRNGTDIRRTDTTEDIADSRSSEVAVAVERYWSSRSTQAPAHNVPLADAVAVRGWRSPKPVAHCSTSTVIAPGPSDAAFLVGDRIVRRRARYRRLYWSSTAPCPVRHFA